MTLIAFPLFKRPSFAWLTRLTCLTSQFFPKRWSLKRRKFVSPANKAIFLTSSSDHVSKFRSKKEKKIHDWLEIEKKNQLANLGSIFIRALSTLLKARLKKNLQILWKFQPKAFFCEGGCLTFGFVFECPWDKNTTRLILSFKHWKETASSECHLIDLIASFKGENNGPEAIKVKMCP